MAETYFAKPQKNWQPYIKPEQKEDWKDFRMSVCRTHIWYNTNESLYQVIGSFHAWMKQGEEMKTNTDEKENENVIPFDEARLKLAAKEPPKGGNWLANLPFETRFLASRNSMNDCMLGDFVICTDPQRMPAILLGFDINSPQGCFRWVDPGKFSRDFTFFMTIETTNEQRPEVQTGRVGGDGEAQVVDPVHETE